ncbi:MAG TPA: DUF4031 domain-containing protein [Streptosporangiaceae bacterium]
MTVYVHKLDQGGGLFGRTSRPDPWFALTADTDDELHAQAVSLGLTRAMFNPGVPGAPRKPAVAAHYNLTQGEHDRAVAHGAQQISARDAERMARAREGGLT